MLNMNSPTVQAMLNNTPEGFGNIPGYYGSSPSVVTTQMAPQTLSQQQSSPFPSPKEMLMQGGQQMIYHPTNFSQPRNIVGGYNPGYQSAFGDYYNPYMGYGYSGYNYGYNPFYQQPMDEDARERLEAANFNNSTYDDQLRDDEKLFKSLSRIVSKNIGRTEEEAEECEKKFSIYDKYAQTKTVNNYRKKPMKFLSVNVTRGDEVLVAMEAVDIDIYKRDEFIRCGYQAEAMKIQSSINEANIIHYRNQLYERAPERAFDNVGLLDFLNNGAGVVLAHDMSREIYEQSLRRTSQIYDKDSFRERLLKNNGLKSKSQRSAIERFAGRYGVMPDGRPVSPGHDPSVASSFSYDPNTGQYSVTAPNFMRDRLELARRSFLRSIDEQ